MVISQDGDDDPESLEDDALCDGEHEHEHDRCDGASSQIGAKRVRGRRQTLSGESRRGSSS